MMKKGKEKKLNVNTLYEKLLTKVKPRYIPGTVSPQYNKTDLLSYVEHRIRVLRAHPKIDNTPPRLNVQLLVGSLKFSSDFVNFKKIAKENFDMVRRINMIHRSPISKTINPNRKASNPSKWAEYSEKLKRIEANNKKFYAALVKKEPTLKTAELEADWKKHFKRIKSSCKLPFVLGLPDPDLVLKTALSCSDGLNLNPPSSRTQIFMDIKLQSGQSVGRMIFELYNDVVPNSVNYFLRLCNESNSLNYKNENIYRIFRDSHCEIGDTPLKIKRNPLYNFNFEQENFLLKHNRPGVLSLRKSSLNKNNLQFLITFSPRPSFDGKHVVIGKLIKGAKALQFLNDMARKVGCFLVGTPLERTYISSIGINPTKSWHFQPKPVAAKITNLNPCHCTALENPQPRRHTDRHTEKIHHSSSRSKHTF